MKAEKIKRALPPGNALLHITSSLVFLEVSPLSVLQSRQAIIHGDAQAREDLVKVRAMVDFKFVRDSFCIQRVVEVTAFLLSHHEKGAAFTLAADSPLKAAQ